MALLTYNPGIFNVPDEGAARRIILTREGGLSTDERWVRETPYLTELMGSRLALKPTDLVVDFGCGIGRIAKALIERYGCQVLGVDISQDMRALAPGYVRSPSFSVVSPEVFGRMVAQGLRVDAAVSIWVLQHCLRPADDIALIKGSLRPKGQFFLVNNINRAIPTIEKPWASDGVDVRELLGEALAEREVGALDAAAVGAVLSSATFWAVYDQR